MQTVSVDEMGCIQTCSVSYVLSIRLSTALTAWLFAKMKNQSDVNIMELEKKRENYVWGFSPIQFLDNGDVLGGTMNVINHCILYVSRIGEMEWRIEMRNILSIYLRVEVQGSGFRTGGLCFSRLQVIVSVLVGWLVAFLHLDTHMTKICIFLKNTHNFTIRLN